MKKNTMMRIASVLLIAVLMTTCVISGTFAKYASTATVTGSVTVARWDIALNGGTFTDQANFNFLASWTDTDDGSDDAAEVVNVTNQKLAPGTEGSFNFEVTNNSEVNARYRIDFNGSLDALDAFLDITIVVGGTDYTLTEFQDDENPVWIPINMEGDPATVTVNWEWPFTVGNNTTDVADTTLGKNAGDFDITAIIYAEQVD